MIQALGIAYSKIVLPSGDSKGESKGRTYCPTTWTHCYQWQYASQYADLLKQGQGEFASMQGMYTSSAHPSEQQECEPCTDCAFADCMSTTMCGAMISLTPCIASTVPRDCDLHESAEFKDATDMIQQLNGFLAKPDGFPEDSYSKERLPHLLCQAR